MFRKLRDFGDQVVMTIDGAPVIADKGETVAAVLLRQSDGWCRETPVSGTRRAPYCMMGVCFDCLAEIDGVRSAQTCLTVVQEGMSVIRQRSERGTDQ